MTRSDRQQLERIAVALYEEHAIDLESDEDRDAEIEADVFDPCPRCGGRLFAWLSLREAAVFCDGECGLEWVGDWRSLQVESGPRYSGLSDAERSPSVVG